MKHRGWVALSGFTWFFIGAFLLYKGLHLISQAAFQPDSLCQQLGFVLSKTVRRVVTRISSLPLPIRLKDAYSPAYWILIASMMALGMLFRFLPIPLDIRGIIDVAIGSALINGAMLYFRASRSIYGIDSPAQSP